MKTALHTRPSPFGRGGRKRAQTHLAGIKASGNVGDAEGVRLSAGDADPSEQRRPENAKENEAGQGGGGGRCAALDCAGGRAGRRAKRNRKKTKQKKRAGALQAA